MQIKNYTSSVSVINSINLIENRLVSAGATHIGKVYDKERVKGITFQIPVNGIPILFKLPTKSEAVFKVLWKEVRKPRPETKKNIELQSERTAWKILADWVDIQITMITLEQAEFIEVFLPYAFDGVTNKTFFEKMKESQYKLLEG